MILGLTGGIACGKSTVAKMFEHLGCIIIDADQVAREVVEPGEQGLEQVVARFGSEVLNERGELNRKRLGSIVFGNEQARLDLNAILHPLIRQRMNEKKEKAKALNPPLILMDIPLLFESKQENTVEGVIVVYVPEPMQLSRLVTRDQLTVEEALARIHSQLSIDVKKTKADYVIDNSRSLNDTHDQVLKLFQDLTKGR